LRIDLPRGAWAELCEPEDITGAQKKAYQRAVDKMMYGDGGGQVSYVPDPENPAVMMPVAPKAGRLTAENIHALREMVHAWCVRSWSYDLPVAAGSFDEIPAMAADVIEEALTEGGHYDVFNSSGPKGKPETELTSSSTSGDPAPAPLPG